MQDISGIGFIYYTKRKEDSTEHRYLIDTYQQTPIPALPCPLWLCRTWRGKQLKGGPCSLAAVLVQRTWAYQ